MTEEEWLKTTNSSQLLGSMRHRSDRKLRLIGCALCRVIWSQLSSLAMRAVEVAEAYADGLDTERNRATYWARLRKMVGEDSSMPRLLPYRVLEVCGWYGAELSIGCGVDTEQEVAIIRDIFGNPFHPITLDPSWLTSTVTTLAQTMYEARDFSAMPILADALQDSGCENAAILNHCRGPGPHVRGCWVADMLLGFL